MPRLVLACLLALLAAVAAPAPAGADPYLPPPGRVFNGLTAGFDTAEFARAAGRPPAVWQHFIAWGGSYRYTIENSRRAGARLMLHLSTARGQHEPERYSPGELARGAGDAFLVGLGRDLAAVGAPTYLRLLGEMNNCDNAYASHGCSGARRDADHAPAAFKAAWRRTWLILHGGPVHDVNARLAALGLPPVRTRETDLAVPLVAFVWAPMVGGSPNIPALRPGAFWPGARWVDWVGTSFYSRFPNFSGLETFYRAFAAAKAKPFAIAEWAIWGADAPAFADRLFAWVASHRRTRMMQYNQGAQPGGIFRLSRYPASARVVRRHVTGARFAAAGRTAARRGAAPTRPDRAARTDPG